MTVRPDRNAWAARAAPRRVRAADLRRLRRDLRQARRVQRRFLPDVPADLEGLRIGVWYRPAYEVGGDFYDWISVGSNRLVCVVGDVSGKGIAAALLMSRITAEFRNVASQHGTPGEILSALNARMGELGPGESFVTAICAEVDGRARRVRIGNAGHLPAVQMHPGGGMTELGEPSGAPLGVLSGERYRDDVAALDPGSMLLLATDGVSEALEASGRLLGNRLRAATAAGEFEPRAVAARVLAMVGQRRADDATVLAIQLTPESAPDWCGEA